MKRNWIKKWIFLITLTPLITQAWTLNNNSGVRFSDQVITVNVSNDACDNTGFSNSDLLTYVKEAIDLYWNSVATSRIELVQGSIIGQTIDAATSAGSVALNNADAGTILVGCNSSATSFSGTTLGLGSISSKVSGAVLINDTASTLVDTLTVSQKIAVIGHEIGHAVGLGHSSNNTALMYYQTDSRIQEHLTQDDKDGITYLYPHESKPGSCGTIALLPSGRGKGPGPGNHGTSFLLGLLLVALLTSARARRKYLKPQFAN